MLHRITQAVTQAIHGGSSPRRPDFPSVSDLPAVFAPELAAAVLDILFVGCETGELDCYQPAYAADNGSRWNVTIEANIAGPISAYRYDLTAWAWKILPQALAATQAPIAGAEGGR